ncbi:hypothetical protein [Thermophilibacter mediterraneus]|uniref:hypothetical protein n=1 Tax=Thermophilibacter mediterraneus TaxID=1871031 RepID=UPI0009314CD3|nr:hypothetical protein [Thermophilibacter mediterraneus]
MEKIELVETVREKAGVGYADAKAALDACGDDILDALVWLEERGYSQTGTARASTGVPGAGVSSEMRAAQDAYARSAQSGRRAAAGWLSRMAAACRRFLRRGMDSRVVSYRNGEKSVQLPLLPTVLGEALWLLLSSASAGRAVYLGPFQPIWWMALILPLICLVYLVFFCRVERPAEEAEGPRAATRATAPAPAPVPVPAPAPRPVTPSPEQRAEERTAPEPVAPTRPTAPEPEAADEPASFSPDDGAAAEKPDAGAAEESNND